MSEFEIEIGLIGRTNRPSLAARNARRIEGQAVAGLEKYTRFLNVKEY